MTNRFLHRFFFLLPITLIFAFQSCKNGSTVAPGNSQPHEKNADGKIVISRYEKVLFGLNKNQLSKEMASLYPEYSFFLGNNWQDTMNILRIYNFLNDPNIQEIYKLTVSKYPEVTSLEGNLTDAFSLYREAYPEKPIPHVFTYVSGMDLENPVYFYDTAMAIGLDLFLGSEASVYAKAGIPKYKSNNFTPEHILAQCMLSVSNTIIRVDEKKNTLLDQMVMAGKALYFLDATLPDGKDEYKIGYTPGQLAWSQKNESKIWAFIIENQLLFSSDSQGITKLLTDAPFTAGFAAESPGRLGAYMGWQIVKEYMKEADGVSLKQLLEDTDAQLILKVSKFKPGKD